MANMHDFKCPHCGALYSKGLRRDDDARYGEGTSVCQVCDAIMEEWRGFEPVYIPVRREEADPG